MEFLQKHSKKGVAIALGFFDCVHLAHRRIIETTIEQAKERDLISSVLTFEGKVKSTDQIYDLSDRIALFKELNVDSVLAISFTPRFASLSPADFVDMLVCEYNCKLLVCGFDFKFGCNASGNVSILYELCRNKGIDLIEIPSLIYDGEVISSSRIKNLLISGEIEKANELLFVPYHVTDCVVEGRGEGHLFGFPTANFIPKSNVLLPKYGVYGTMCDINGVKYKSVTNVGIKPSFNDDTVTIETFIDGFSENIYNQKVTLYFYKRIRDTKKFDFPSELKDQIYLDMRW